MNKDLITKLRKAVAVILGCPIRDIQMQEMQKDNGVVKTGLFLNEGTVRAICYVDELLQDIEEGNVSLEDAAEEISRSIRDTGRARDHAIDFFRMSKDAFLEGIHIRMLNSERNGQRKEQFLYFEFLDLIGVFYFKINDNESILVSGDLADHFGVSEDELKTSGVNNIIREQMVAPIKQVLMAIEGLRPTDGDTEDTEPMYVITNQSMSYGASTMLITETFEKLADKLGEDLLILPSSKHEVIAVPDNGRHIDALSWMVWDINTYQVTEEDFLSDSVYRYKRGSGCIEIAE